MIWSLTGGVLFGFQKTKAPYILKSSVLNFSINSSKTEVDSGKLSIEKCSWKTVPNFSLERAEGCQNFLKVNSNFLFD